MLHKSTLLLFRTLASNHIIVWICFLNSSCFSILKNNDFLKNIQIHKKICLYLFKITVVKPGQNTIIRESAQSSVTIPFERTFRDLSEKPTEGDALQEYNFCGCGWPEHMLIPKGTPEGMPSQLFVMISNFEDDKVSTKWIFQYFP